MSKLQCEGYLFQPPLTNTQATGEYGSLINQGAAAAQLSDNTVLRLCTGPSGGCGKDLKQERLAQLGCRILVQETHRNLGPGTPIWNILLPQLSNAIPSVNAAAATLGAVYEATLLASSSSLTTKQGATIQYGRAIRHIQQDVSSQLYGPVPLLVSCALLAFAEILQRRQYNALTHLQGALKLLHSRDQVPVRRMSPGSPATNDCDMAGAATTITLEDDISLMFMTLDIQTASYALGQPPCLSVSAHEDPPHTSLNTRNINEAGRYIVRLIHSCYHFTAHASESKYLPRPAVPSELVLEQGRHIANLSLWIHILNKALLFPDPNPGDNLSPDTHCHALILRTQCLSTLIYVSTVLNPEECSYDLHGPQFQQIIRDAATILAQDSGSSSPLRQFRPSPGIVQPLFFTAIKYRHGLWRRQAVELLRRSGREGPFDGKLLAEVAGRAVEIEEAGSRAPAPAPAVVVPLAEHIPEVHRLHGCGMDAEARDEDDGQPMHSVTVMFSRCRNVERMLCGVVSWDDGCNWDIWDEAVEF